MQYLPIREFDSLTNALNFSTPDIHVIGGCDVYTTKAAGGDKKLYKNIENTLESQHANLVRLSASLSPPYQPAKSDDGKGSEKSSSRDRRGRSVGVPEIDLSRPSPFGPLSQISARRTFAYLIATLNASHPDYDFSHTLRPSDFRKERSLQKIMMRVDSTMQNLRPKHHGLYSNSYLAPPHGKLSSSAPGVSGIGADVWNPRAWSLIDKEMSLRNCERYSWSPDDDPFDGEEGALWSIHYFFFNKEKKRVCYFYLRGFSVISHSPVAAPVFISRPSAQQRKASSILSVGEGAGKRANYWLGNGGQVIDTSSYGEDDDDEMMIAEQPDDDEVEVPYMDLDTIRNELADGYYSPDDFDDGFAEDGWKPLRGVSEEIGARIDL